MIDIPKAKADAEEGLRIAEKATEGPFLVCRPRDQDGGAAVGHTGPTFGQAFRFRTSIRCASPNNNERPSDQTSEQDELNALFFADSRTRAPEAYRNVVALAEENDRLRAELAELRRYASVRDLTSP